MQVEFAEFPRAKLFVGGCVARGVGSSFRASAHAHTSEKDKFKGWICVRSKNPDTLRLIDGEPTNLMKHEYAHILTGEGHTDRYWRVLASIGGYMERESYFGHKRSTYLPLRQKWEDVRHLVVTDCVPIDN